MADARRILFVLHLAEMSGPARGFAGRLTLLARRRDISVLAPGPGPGTRLFAERWRTGVGSYAMLSVPRTPREARRWARSNMRDLRAFVAAIRTERPTIVFTATTATPMALLAGRLTGRTVVAYCGELFDKGHTGGAARRAGSAALRWLLPRICDGIVCCSEAVQTQFTEDRRARLVTVHPGIPDPGEAPDAATCAAQLGLLPGVPMVLVVGLVNRGRGQDVAIDAVADLARRGMVVQLAIVGAPVAGSADEDYLVQCRARARALGIADHVRFAGHRDDVRTWLAAADVVVNPARFNEPFGRVAFEALRAGRPVVSTAVGAIPDILTDGETALLVPPDAPAAIAAAIGRLLDDPALAAGIVADGGAHAALMTDERRQADAVARFLTALDGHPAIEADG